MQCECKNGFYLSKINEIYEVEKSGVLHRFHKARLLRCIDCNKVSVPLATKIICEKIIEGELPEPTSSVYEYDFEKIINMSFTDKFMSTKVSFLYDRDDYYFLPGLTREWNIGFLTPIYFNIEVLLKYSHHPLYSIELGADTYGYIYKEENFMLPFGINPNGTIIMWLGDIRELDVNEQHYLRSENVVSENNIHSQFYEAQIETIWADPSKENQIFAQRKDLHEKILSSFNISLTQLEPETLKEAKHVRKPIVGTKEAFAKVIISMNKIFVESLNSKVIKELLVNKFGLKVDKLGGLKLFQMWLESCTDIDSDNVRRVVSPLFILYDLRIAMAHLQSEETTEGHLSSACERLGIEKSCRDYLKIYDHLIDHIDSMYKEILSSTFTNTEEVQNG